MNPSIKGPSTNDKTQGSRQLLVAALSLLLLEDSQFPGVLP